MASDNNDTGEEPQSARLLKGVVMLDATVRQDANGSVARKYALANVPARESCANPRCEGGGLDLYMVAACIASGEHHFYCQGFENGQRGASGPRPCSNHFLVTLRVTRLVATPNKDG